MNGKGKIISEKLDNAIQAGNCFIIQKNGFYGLINSAGKTILEPKFSSISETPANHFIVESKNHQYGIFDSLGKDLMSGKTVETISHLAGDIYSAGKWGNLRLFDARTGSFFHRGNLKIVSRLIRAIIKSSFAVRETMFRSLTL